MFLSHLSVFCTISQIFHKCIKIRNINCLPIIAILIKLLIEFRSDPSKFYQKACKTVKIPIVSNSVSRNRSSRFSQASFEVTSPMFSKRHTQTCAFAAKGDSMPMYTRVHVYLCTSVHACTCGEASKLPREASSQKGWQGWQSKFRQFVRRYEARPCSSASSSVTAEG